MTGFPRGKHCWTPRQSAFLRRDEAKLCFSGEVFLVSASQDLCLSSHKTTHIVAYLHPTPPNTTKAQAVCVGKWNENIHIEIGAIVGIRVCKALSTPTSAGERALFCQSGLAMSEHELRHNSSSPPRIPSSNTFCQHPGAFEHDQTPSILSVSLRKGIT